jgi:uncharacterized membrane protein YfcA
MELHIILLVILVGFFAGFINTLAGNGSLLSLPLLMFLGLPANIANATNRIGVLLQSLVASVMFKSIFGCFGWEISKSHCFIIKK